MVRRSGGKIGGYVRVGGHGMRRSRVFFIDFINKYLILRVLT